MYKKTYKINLVALMMLISVGVIIIYCGINKGNINHRLEAKSDGIATVNQNIVCDDENIHKIENEEIKGKEIKHSEIKKPVIVIDPGHSGKASSEREPVYPGASETKRKESGGAVGVVTKIPEYKTVMDISFKLKDILEEKGYTVIMTRTNHEVILGNVERARIGNDANADLVIRVHADSTSNQGVSGASMLIPENNKRTGSIYEKSKKCAEVVMQELVNEAGMKNRGIITRGDLTGFNWSKVPVILLEAGFLSNPNEDRMLNSPEYQDKIARGLAKGIEKSIPIEVKE